MATALVLTPPPQPALTGGCGSWRKCSAGSAKLVAVVLPLSEKLEEKRNTCLPIVEDEDYTQEYDGLDEEDDDNLDEVTERVLDLEDAYLTSSCERKTRNNRAVADSKKKRADTSLVRTRRVDHSKHPLSFAREKHATQEEYLDRLFAWDWDQETDRLVVPEADYNWPRERVRARSAEADLLYPSRWFLRLRRREKEPGPASCKICMEDFGWHLTEHHKTRPELSYAAALRMPRDPTKLAYLDRHTSCANSRCGICVTCFKRDVQRQIEKPSFFFNYIRRHEGGGAIGVSCISCHTRYTSEPGPRSIGSILSRAVLETISERILQFHLRSSPDVSFCPSPNCSAAVFFDPKANCTLLSCPHCPSYWCYVCRVPFHFGRTCAEFQAGDPVAAWRAKNTKPCPSCHIAIEKNGGCSHMHCALCDLHFTWTEQGFGEYLPAASATRVSLRTLQQIEAAERWMLTSSLFSLEQAKKRYSADDAELFEEDEEEEEEENEHDARLFRVVPDFSVAPAGVSRRRRNKSHDAQARNMRRAAARTHRRLADRFPDLYPLLQLNNYVSVAAA